MYPPEEEVKIPTLKEAFYDYMEEKKNAGKLRSHTALNYEKYFDKHLKPLHNKAVDKVTQSDLVKIIFRSIFLWCFCRRRKGEVLGLKWCDIDLDI